MDEEEIMNGRWKRLAGLGALGAQEIEDITCSAESCEKLALSYERHEQEAGFSGIKKSVTMGVMAREWREIISLDEEAKKKKALLFEAPAGTKEALDFVIEEMKDRIFFHGEMLKFHEENTSVYVGHQQKLRDIIKSLEKLMDLHDLIPQPCTSCTPLPSPTDASRKLPKF